MRKLDQEWRRLSVIAREIVVNNSGIDSRTLRVDHDLDRGNRREHERGRQSSR